MKTIWALGFAMLVTTSRAEAQTRPRELYVGVAGGNAVGVGTDASAPRQMFSASVRMHFRQHLATDVELAHSGRTDDFESGAGRFSGSNGVIGQYQSASTHITDSTWSGAFSLLAHSNARVSVFGGGGFGYGVTRHDYIVSYTGCSAPTSPQTCRGYSLPRNGEGLTLHITGGVDARITDRIGAFASTQLQGAYLYGPTALRGLIGIRVRL